MTIQDALGCDTTIDFDVFELSLELDTLADYVFPPSCFGYTDGSIVVTMANGQAPYQFNWNGTGFQPNNSLFNLNSCCQDLI